MSGHRRGTELTSSFKLQMSRDSSVLSYVLIHTVMYFWTARITLFRSTSYLFLTFGRRKEMKLRFWIMFHIKRK